MPGPMDPVHDYPGYQPGQKRPTPWLAISLAIAVVIIIVLAAVVISQLKGDKSDAPTAAPTPSSAVPLPQPSGTQPPQAGSGSTTMTCEGFTAAVDPTSQPGWHATVNRSGLAYAAPPDWNVAECGVRMGWAKPCPEGQCVIREIGAVATVANPSCPEQNLAMAGVGGSKNPDIKAALDEEMKTVPLIYSQNGQRAQGRVHRSAGVQHRHSSGRADGGVRERHRYRHLHRFIGNPQHGRHHGAQCRGVRRLPHLVASGREPPTPKPEVINKMVDTLRSPA